MKNLLLILLTVLCFSACQKSNDVQPNSNQVGANERRDNSHRQHNQSAGVYSYDGQKNHPLDSTTYYGNTYAELCFSANFSNDSTVLAVFDYTDIYGTVWHSSRYLTFNNNTVVGITNLYPKHGEIDNCNNECDVQAAPGSTVTVTFYPTSGTGGGEVLTLVFQPII